MKEPDYSAHRRGMVRDQLIQRGIHDPRVLQAMAVVPRHVFVAPELRPHAYDDAPLRIDAGQTISQPYMVGLMTELLELRSTDRVLEVGTGSGYQTALLGLLAAEVVTIERHQTLAAAARRILAKLDLRNVFVIEGDGTMGCPDRAPFDAIIVTAAGPKISAPLREQLAVGGRLVCPVGNRDVQRLIRIRRSTDGFRTEEGIECRFVPLVGEEGWAETGD